MTAARLSVLDLAQRQHGVIARRQELASGMHYREIDEQLDAGAWHEILRGVHRVGGAPVTREMLMMAATLRVEGALISHQTAGTALRLETPAAEYVHVSVPRTASGRTTELIIDDGPQYPCKLSLHRPRRLSGRDMATVSGIPCTTPARTLIDLAAALREERVEAAFETARRLGLVSVDELRERVDELCGRGRRGSTALRRLLERQSEDSAPVESRLELKLARLLDAAGIDTLTRQFDVRLATGARVRIDFADVTAKVAVECEGFSYHANRLRWEQDRRRTALLEALGWRVMTITWDDVTRAPELTAQRIADAIAAGHRASA